VVSSPANGANVETFHAGVHDPKVIDARLRAVEEARDLLQYQVAGWCAWPIVRFTVFKVRGFGLSDAVRWSRVDRLRDAVADVLGVFRLRRSDILIKAPITGLLELEGETYRNIWFDDVAERLGATTRLDIVDNPAYRTRRAQARHRGAMSTTAIDVATSVLARLWAPRGTRAAGAALSKALEDDWGLLQMSAQEVDRRLRHFVWQKRLYTLLFTLLRPKVLLVADFGDYASVAAARERGITVFEIQHGFADRFHSGYSWSAYARRYASRLPVPHRLLLFGQYWANELGVHGFWSHELRVVGSARMDRWRSRRKLDRAGRPPVVLVTTQGIDTSALAEFIRAFVEQRPAGRPVRVIIKLHPTYDPYKDVYTRSFHNRPDVEILLGQEGPSTFELLCDADLHVSISSTCHLDAIGLGVPTAVLPLTSFDFVAPLVDAGDAVLLRDPGHLDEIVDALGARRMASDRAEQYFQPGAVDGICREIAKELANHP